MLGAIWGTILAVIFLIALGIDIGRGFTGDSILILLADLALVAAYFMGRKDEKEER